MKLECFPDWVIEKLEIHSIEETGDTLTSFLREYDLFYKYMQKFQDKASCYEILDIELEHLKTNFGDQKRGIAHAAESLTAVWYFSNIYKLRSYLNGFNSMLESGNLLVAASCARCIIEQIACFNYFVRKIENKTQIFADKIERTPDDEGKEKLAVGHIYDEMSLCIKGIQGTDFEWINYIKKRVPGKYHHLLPNTEIVSKKLHINDALKSLKDIDKNIMNHYAALCDCVHPNVGSFWLVMDKREINETMPWASEITLTDRPKNYDAVVFLLLILSTSLSGAILKHAREQIESASAIYKRRRILAESL